MCVCIYMYIYIYVRVCVWVYVWRFPKMRVPPNPSILRHFSIETNGFWGCTMT